MKPETRAKKDKCALVASVDHGKLRVLGVSDDPLIVLEGRSSSCGPPGHRSTSSRGMLRAIPPLRRTPMRIPRQLSRTDPGGWRTTSKGMPVRNTRSPPGLRCPGYP
jgi:hypothetical protein